MKPLVYLGTRHIRLSGASSGYFDMRDCSNTTVGTGSVEGTGFGVIPRQLQITAALGTSTGYTLGTSTSATSNASLTFATADELLTYLGVGTDPAEGWRPDRRYLNWVLLSGTTATSGGANDYIIVEAWG